MLGAVFGDIVGSVYERYNVKSKNFPLESSDTRFTDDSVMTLAVARWLLEDQTHSSEHLVHCVGCSPAILNPTTAGATARPCA